MSIPLIHHDVRKSEYITPAAFITYKKSVKKIRASSKFPKICILTSHKNISEYLIKKYNASPQDGWTSDRSVLYAFISGGKKVGILNTLIGAPLAAIFVELLIASGIETIIVLGSIGGVGKNCNIGDLVLVTKALRDEGTSLHYLPPSEYAYPDVKLKTRLGNYLNRKKISFISGPICTTDAFFRSLSSDIKKYQKNNILGIDMETAAIFAVAKFRKITAVSLQYVSDLLNTFKWKPKIYGHDAEITQKHIADMIMDFIFTQNDKAR